MLYFLRQYIIRYSTSKIYCLASFIFDNVWSSEFWFTTQNLYQIVTRSGRICFSPITWSLGFNQLKFVRMATYVDVQWVYWSILCRVLPKSCNCSPRRWIDVPGNSPTLLRTALILTIGRFVFGRPVCVCVSSIFQVRPDFSIPSSQLTKFTIPTILCTKFSSRGCQNFIMFEILFNKELNSKPSAVKWFFFATGLPTVYWGNGGNFKSYVNFATFFIN